MREGDCYVKHHGENPGDTNKQCKQRRKTQALGTQITLSNTTCKHNALRMFSK